MQPSVPGPTYDIAIVGGGPVGLCLAAMLAQRWGAQAHRIALLEATPTPGPGSPVPGAQRVLALSEATRLALAPYFFPDNAVPMHHIHVSEQGVFGRVALSAQALGLPALGWTVRYGDLVQGLWRTVQALGVTVLRPVRALPFAASAGEGGHAHTSFAGHGCTVPLEGGQFLSCHLRVDAEGGMFADTNPRDLEVNYAQSALVADLELVLDTQAWPPRRSPMPTGPELWAFERFTPNGPLALLPIKHPSKHPSAPQGMGQPPQPLHYSLVWCGPPALTAQRLAMSQAELGQHLHTALGRRVRVLAVGQRKSFALGLNWRRTLVQGRCVAVGNAAQILHPVAGQGLNLGLRDAQALARGLSPVVLQSPAGLDQALAHFERARAPDRRCVLALSHGLVRGFGSPCGLVGGARQLLLQGLECLPPIKTEFAQLMVYGWVRG